MQKTAFLGFLAFGILTVAVAFAGGLWAFFQNGGMSGKALGLLLIVLGASLAAMLGSLALIQSKERRSFKSQKACLPAGREERQ